MRRGLRISGWILIAAAAAPEAALAQSAAPSPSKPGANKAAPANAQQAPAAAQAPDAKQLKAAAVAAAQKSYDAGTRAFEAGKHKEAVAQLSSALAGGGLPSPQMAKALYYRGVSNRKLGKPAQAMSDLTTAIWVSGGLTESDRAAAIENRQAAYREAGLGDMAPGDVPPNAGAASTPPAVASAASPPAQSTPAPAQPAVSPAPAPGVSPSPSAAPGIDVADASPPPAAAAAKPKAVSRDEGVPNPFAESTEPAPAPQPTLAAAPEPAPLPANPGSPNMFEKAGNSIAEAGSNVGNFFGNMFKSSPPPPPAQPQTALTQTAVPLEPQASASPVLTAANPDGTASAAEGWGDTTEVKSAKGTKVAAVAPPPIVSSPAAIATPVSTGAIAPAQAAKPAMGKYQLQVAAVRSREEAEALAEKVRQQHASALGGRQLVIDEAVIGNFGSFHRVRIGPYADAKEPGKFCSTLIKTGFDCLVVTQ